MENAHRALEDGFRQYMPTASGNAPNRGLDKNNISYGDAYSYSRAMLKAPTAQGLFAPWAKNLEEEFNGITTDGNRRANLFPIRDEAAPTAAVVAAANRFLDQLNADEQMRVVRDLDSAEWRKWSNTEIIWHDIGLRLENLEQVKIDLIWGILRETLSEIGYAKIQGAVKINKFLGVLTDNPGILNEKSYFFCMFGRPSERQPWGYTFFGHHLCVNVCFIHNQMTIGPTFVGCEPNVIDEGPDQGVELFRDESTLALQLMNSLTTEQRRLAQKASSVEDLGPNFNIIEQRHLAGTAQDNRVIPYDGVCATTLTTEQQTLLLDIVRTFQELLPARPLAYRLELVKQNLPETYFMWMGAFGDQDPFYFRIQSPVCLVELDCHTGIYLTNKTPKKHHVHSIHRIPNGGDYGKDLTQQWRQKNPGKPRVGHLKYIRQLDVNATGDTPFPKYKAQILSSLESGLIIASHIGEGGCGPNLHYHESDQMYYLIRGQMKIRLRDTVCDVHAGSLVFIPAGLPHCNWNPGPGSETHLEMIIPAPHRFRQIAYSIKTSEDVPIEARTSLKGYVLPVDPKQLSEPLPGFKIKHLADPSSGSADAAIMYAEVAPGSGGPGTHVHEFDQYYFVLEGQMTVELALQKQNVRPNMLVVIPAGVPHRQYNDGPVVEKHITINTPPPELGKSWEYGTVLTPTHERHQGSFQAGRDLQYVA